MYLTDFHVHSDVSMDSQAPMWDMIAAEAAAGVKCMCFTNHCDLVRWNDFQPNPRCLEITGESVEKLAAARAAPDQPNEVRLGLELAESQYDPALAARLAADPALDFVLGSMHILPEAGDYYFLPYTNVKQCECYYDLYLDQLDLVAEQDFYDVLAHLGYARRYMWRAGVDAPMSLARFGDKVEHILRTVIGKGKGLEINCSGIRDGCGPFPSVEILRRYRELGGEIITVGSDAHRPEDAAKAVAAGVEVLKDCGFDYVCVFRRRTPEFIKI